MKNSKMPVEIWSDIMCPFCYIGKRKFEKALEDFSGKDKIEIIWKSFQLAPDMKSEPGKNINQFLAEHKHIPLEQAKQMNDRVSEMAKQNGLTYHFDTSVVANSMDAHRLSHLAKQNGVQNQLEEKLFSAYFTEGKDVANHSTLIELGKSVGMKEDEMKNVLSSDKFREEVEADIVDAQEIGVRGVPFFAMNRRYAVAGAQDSSIILQTLEKAFSEWQKENAEIVS